MAIKILKQSQTQAFDTDYVTAAAWEIVLDCIKNSFPDGDFTFLDIGGGNGLFTDRILNTFPKSRGILLDNSDFLIRQNSTQSRKKIICDTVENIGNHITEKIDIVFCNWLLHHLVSTSYSKTRDNISQTLLNIRQVLSSHGRLSIFENMYNGMMSHNLPSHLIYGLTSSKKLAPVIGRMGANTAGCGVCFLSRKEWGKTITAAGYDIGNYSEGNSWLVPLHRRVILHIGKIRVGHFWTRPS